jgi:hypothetical protein
MSSKPCFSAAAHPRQAGMLALMSYPDTKLMWSFLCRLMLASGDSSTLKSEQRDVSLPFNARLLCVNMFNGIGGCESRVHVTML